MKKVFKHLRKLIPNGKSLDILIILTLVVIYGAFALPKLGSTNIPETSWQPAKQDESFVIDFMEIKEISKILLYCKMGEATYRVESIEDGIFKHIADVNQTRYNAWQIVEQPLSIKTDKIRITFTVTNTNPIETEPGILNEMAFCEAKTGKFISNFKIIDKNVSTADKGKLENLFDEQDRMPLTSNYFTEAYFDEIHFARTAYEYINLINPSETTHPPLGKLLISCGILIFGMNPFGWRIMVVVFGALMIPLLYYFGLKLFKSRYWAFLAAFLLTFDFFHFVESRIATIDIFVTFFTMAATYFMYDYYVQSPSLRPNPKEKKSLLFCGLMLGLACACKWVGIYIIPALFLLFVMALRKKYMILKSGMKKREQNGFFSQFFEKYIISVFLHSVLFFAVIPAVIYFASYIPIMLIPGPGHDFLSVIRNQDYMLYFHSTNRVHFDFSSPFWSWPLMLKPVVYFINRGLDNDTVSAIIALGNPAVWWLTVPAVLTTGVLAFKNKAAHAAVIIIGFCVLYLPWMFVPREIFIYHYFVALPFGILAIVYVLQYAVSKRPALKFIVTAYAGITVALFAVFYPLISGQYVKISYLEALVGWAQTVVSRL